MMQEKICESCGMPMREKSDFGGNDPYNKYCKHCTFDNGELKDFETKLKEMTNFIISRMNVNATLAERIAKENMAKQPAWKVYF